MLGVLGVLALRTGCRSPLCLARHGIPGGARTTRHFYKNHVEVPGGNTLGRFFPRAQFFRNVRASVRFAKTHAPQGTPANGQGLGTRRSVPVAAVTQRLTPRDLCTVRVPPPLPADCPPRPDFAPAIICPIGHPRRATSAPPRRNGGIGRTVEQPDRRAISVLLNRIYTDNK